LLFGQVPALELQDGTVLVQTIAIMRYLARVAPASLELYPSDPVKAALVDSISDQWGDTTAGYQVERLLLPPLIRVIHDCTSNPTFCRHLFDDCASNPSCAATHPFYL
jgi:glutathione S-transferase